jgi:hypothetical protein
MRHLRCVALCENRMLYLTENYCFSVSGGNIHQPTAFVVKKVCDGYLGSNVSITESPSGLKFANWLIWYSLSKPATIHPTSPSSHCES